MRIWSLTGRGGLAIAIAVAILATFTGAPGYAQQTKPEECGADGTLPARDKVLGEQQPDLLIKDTCRVVGDRPYFYGKVNIIGPKGRLIFVEPDAEPSTVKGQDFWASAIIIENEGQLLAGVDYDRIVDERTGKAEKVEVKPYGQNLKTLTIHLYGKDPGMGAMGALCAPPTPDRPLADFTDCGIPRKIWETNGEDIEKLPGDVVDRFYRYSSLHGDAACPDRKDNCPDTVKYQNIGHFGNKVLALSYGGTLELRGKKGTKGTSGRDIGVLQADLDAAAPDAATNAGNAHIVTDSGTDWVRLAGGGAHETSALTLGRSVAGDWTAGDKIVVTTTDFFPDHSEVLTIKSVAEDGLAITVEEPIKYDHNATAYQIGAKLPDKKSAFEAAIEKVDGEGPDGKKPPFLQTAETRAAVGLLTRSIRIVSEGDKAGDTFQDATMGRAKVHPNDEEVAPNPSYMYGAQAVFRQGFQKLQIQGVEFKQMGQGGVIGRYPVHFHIARKVPDGTYVIDSSIDESMTRWVVIHDTLGVTVARNVGYKSIGHGFYLEDATETDNRLYSNLGVFARAGVKDLPKQNDTDPDGPNPRNIPGILSSNVYPKGLPLKYHSDAQYPSVFWITNGWNSFAGNMAAGAGTCGACYWIPSTANHDMMDVPPGNDDMKPMQWKGYSAIQAGSRFGRSPIKLFYKNYCTSAMHSINNSDGSPCNVVSNDLPAPSPILETIFNPHAPDSPNPANVDGDKAESNKAKMYYPRYTGQRQATVCNPGKPLDDADGGCERVDCQNPDPTYCAVTVFSHYTTSFNWAEGNFSAVWMRAGWLMFDHGFISDVQGAGITQVSGGDYSRPNVPVGYWALVTNSIFVGSTQTTNPFASSVFPADCKHMPPPNDVFCVDRLGSTAFVPASAAFMVGQRLYNIYDGPAYEDANAYLDINVAPCETRESCLSFDQFGVRRAVQAYPPVGKDAGYIPNAAIGWKQPNGFYYPPAFHSRNLFFSNVDIRHYVIEPLTVAGTYKTDTDQFKADYVGQSANTTGFDNWTDVDRQTELNDDDGSLTGFSNTISLNEDPYFRAPIQTAQCLSNLQVDPKDACAPQPTGKNRISVPTARTSPYDHITTVIYPGCAVVQDSSNDPSADARAACNQDKKTDRDWSWGRDCTNQACYGVPIYRQFLTDGDASNPRESQLWDTRRCGDLGDELRKMAPGNDYQLKLDAFEKICRFPFIRMAGVSGWQRSVLTTNNGDYYIDTTVSMTRQIDTKDLLTPGPERTVNVFAKGQKYYVFFVFAKNDGGANVTKQTYRIYVGPGFDPNSVEGVKISPKGWPMTAGSIEPWGDFPWKPTAADVKDGVLTIRVDFKDVPQSEIDPAFKGSGAAVLKETCKPVSFCKRDGANDCTCDTAKIAPLMSLYPAFKAVCENTCSHWAVKDLDCPGDGCRGFSFTLPDGFGTAADEYRRPKPEAFPTKKPSNPWATIVFEPTKTEPDHNAGEACNYDAAHIPGTGSCKAVE